MPSMRPRPGLVALAAGLLLAACEDPAPKAGAYSDARPPLRFQREAMVVVQLKTQAEIGAVCESLRQDPPPPGRRYLACATPALHVAYLSNPCDYPDERYAKTFCHELGHLNGWPGDHPR